MKKNSTLDEALTTESAVEDPSIPIDLEEMKRVINHPIPEWWGLECRRVSQIRPIYERSPVQFKRYKKPCDQQNTLVEEKK